LHSGGLDKVKAVRFGVDFGSTTVRICLEVGERFEGKKDDKNANTYGSWCTEDRDKSHTRDPRPSGAQATEIRPIRAAKYWISNLSQKRTPGLVSLTIINQRAIQAAFFRCSGYPSGLL
jgi:hypothetical protein